MSKQPKKLPAGVVKSTTERGQDGSRAVNELEHAKRRPSTMPARARAFTTTGIDEAQSGNSQ
jgi:hypothetical protein